MNLIVDAPFWVGNKNEWDQLIKNSNSVIELDDKVLAYELVNIKYNNLIEVQSVEFLENYLCIFLEGENVLSIACCSDSDSSWILEEYNDKSIQEKMMISCQGNELIAKNISEMN